MVCHQWCHVLSCLTLWKLCHFHPLIPAPTLLRTNRLSTLTPFPCVWFNHAFFRFRSLINLIHLLLMFLYLFLAGWNTSLRLFPVVYSNHRCVTSMYAPLLPCIYLFFLLFIYIIRPSWLFSVHWFTFVLIYNKRAPAQFTPHRWYLETSLKPWQTHLDVNISISFIFSSQIQMS